MLRQAAAFALACCASSAAWAANTWGTDMSDLWWDRDESGWGANIAHQGEVLFITFFVYGADNRPRWFVAPSTASGSPTGASSSDYNFTGPLYETTGPHFAAGTFDPRTVATRAVGSVSVRFPTENQGELSYGVDGTTVTKTIERQTFRDATLAGRYQGTMLTISNGACGGVQSRAQNVTLQVEHVAGAVTLTETAASGGVLCTYNGAYSQAGRMGRISGGATCNDGTRAARFVASEIEAGRNGLLMRFSGDWGLGCTRTGSLAVVKVP